MACEVSVCIPTHRRPEGLERLLASLVAQRDAPPFDVIIVDNDSARSGEKVAMLFSDRLSLSYFVEPIRGLARVRNLAVTSTKTQFIAFIDDDEWAPPKWLATIYRVAIEFNADVVVGGVEQVFDDEVSDYIRVCGLFDNPSRRDGTPLPWYQTRTSNTLIRRESLPDCFTPFSTELDLVGGEDVRLFKQMLDRGACIVAAELSVFESRPIDRANLRWVLRRALRNGSTFGDVEWGRSDWKMGTRRLLDAVVTAIRNAASVIVLWNKDRLTAGRHVVRVCEEAGKILYLCGIRIEEYRTHS